jgi:hypothetical protein
MTASIMRAVYSRLQVCLILLALLATARAFRRAGLANPLLHCADGDSALDLLYQRRAYAAPTEAPRPGVILPDQNLPGTEGGTCSRS